MSRDFESVSSSTSESAVEIGLVIGSLRGKEIRVVASVSATNDGIPTF